MRESRKAFQDVVRDMFVANEWTLLQTVPCLAYSSRLDALTGWHGDDFYMEGERETLDEVDLGDLQGQSAPTVGTRCERGGSDPETHPQLVNGRRSPDARCEACGEFGKSPRSGVQSQAQHLVHGPLVAVSGTCWSR